MGSVWEIILRFIHLNGETTKSNSGKREKKEDTAKY